MLDCSLVSSENFSEILPPNSWRPGPGKVGQGGQKPSTYNVTHKKPALPKQNFFFECRLEDLLRLLTLRPGPEPEQERRYSHAMPRAFRRFFSENPRKQPDAKELTNLINDDAFVLVVMADMCSMVHLACLFVKMHLLALLQDNCLDLVCCASCLRAWWIYLRFVNTY